MRLTRSNLVALLLAVCSVIGIGAALASNKTKPTVTQGGSYVANGERSIVENGTSRIVGRFRREADAEGGWRLTNFYLNVDGSVKREDVTVSVPGKGVFVLRDHSIYPLGGYGVQPNNSEPDLIARGTPFQEFAGVRGYHAHSTDGSTVYDSWANPTLALELKTVTTSSNGDQEVAVVTDLARTPVDRIVVPTDLSVDWSTFENRVNRVRGVGGDVQGLEVERGRLTSTLKQE